MLGDLSHDQISDVLHRQLVGRICCHADDRTYVVPVSYAYDGESLYASSAPGLKLEMMRRNPRVCFEVEELDGLDDWRSVIAWGVFEELGGVEADDALQRLKTRLLPRTPSVTAAALSAPHTFEGETTGREEIIFRIQLGEMTGRFENPGG